MPHLPRVPLHIGHWDEQCSLGFIALNTWWPCPSQGFARSTTTLNMVLSRECKRASLERNERSIGSNSSKKPFVFDPINYNPDGSRKRPRSREDDGYVKRRSTGQRALTQVHRGILKEEER